MRQALTLAPAEANVVFAAVTAAGGYGPTAMATVSPGRARRALDDALAAARDAGVQADVRLIEGAHAADAILELGEASDLLVVGTSPHSRVGGIALGRVATAVAHQAPCDVLLARRARSGRPFPRHILLAFDGTPVSRRAADLVEGIACRAESDVTILGAGRSDAGRRRTLAEASVGLLESTGREPVTVEVEGDAHERIVELARALDVSLVAVGSRRLHGVRALGSVSERVAHTAPCSVLVARGGEETRR